MCCKLQDATLCTEIIRIPRAAPNVLSAKTLCDPRAALNDLSAKNVMWPTGCPEWPFSKNVTWPTQGAEWPFRCLDRSFCILVSHYGFYPISRLVLCASKVLDIWTDLLFLYAMCDRNINMINMYLAVLGCTKLYLAVIGWTWLF